jgi:hypothetical protein
MLWFQIVALLINVVWWIVEAALDLSVLLLVWLTQGKLSTTQSAVLQLAIFPIDSLMCHLSKYMLPRSQKVYYPDGIVMILCCCGVPMWITLVLTLAWEPEPQVPLYVYIIVGVSFLKNIRAFWHSAKKTNELQAKVGAYDFNDLYNRSGISLLSLYVCYDFFAELSFALVLTYDNDPDVPTAFFIVDSVDKGILILGSLAYNLGYLKPTALLHFSWLFLIVAEMAAFAALCTSTGGYVALASMVCLGYICCPTLGQFLPMIEKDFQEEVMIEVLNQSRRNALLECCTDTADVSGASSEMSAA